MNASPIKIRDCYLTQPEYNKIAIIHISYLCDLIVSKHLPFLDIYFRFRFSLLYYNFIERKFQTVIVNNSINTNKPKNRSQLIEHKKHDKCQYKSWFWLEATTRMWWELYRCPLIMGLQWQYRYKQTITKQPQIRIHV